MALEGLRLIGRRPFFGLTQIIGKPLFECVVREARSLGLDEISKHNAQASLYGADHEPERSVRHERFFEHGTMRLNLSRGNRGKTSVCEAHRRTKAMKVDDRSEHRHWGALCGLFPFK